MRDYFIVDGRLKSLNISIGLFCLFILFFGAFIDALGFGSTGAGVLISGLGLLMFYKWQYRERVI